MSPLFQIGERESLSRAVVCQFGVLVKAKPEGDRRLIEIEASVEKEDAEGDLILQSALLASGDKFIKTGHFDIDHYSELGDQLGIPNPDSWIVGQPTKVWGGAGKSTMVQGELFKSIDGTFNPDRNKYDALWASLTSTPPVQWRASVFGYMGPDTVDCRTEVCQGGPARFLVKHFDWCSLAFTRNPVNQSIGSFARVVAAKAFVSGLEKGKSSLDDLFVAKQPEFQNSPARATMAHVLDSHHCPNCGPLSAAPTLPAYKAHFEKCCSMSPDDAELCGHAAMYRCLMGMAKILPFIYGPGNDSLDERKKKTGQRGSAGN